MALVGVSEKCQRVAQKDIQRHIKPWPYRFHSRSLQHPYKFSNPCWRADLAVSCYSVAVFEWYTSYLYTIIKCLYLYCCACVRKPVFSHLHWSCIIYTQAVYMATLHSWTNITGFVTTCLTVYHNHRQRNMIQSLAYL